MGEISFFTSESYETYDKNNKPMSAYDLTILTSMKDVNIFLSSNYKKKAAVSFSELFGPYTTNTDTEFMPYMDLTQIREDQNVVASDGTILPATYPANPGSGDARQEILAADFASGINYGVCPTFADEQNTQIYDKDDATNINSIAFRMPMLGMGFGYTTEGLPTPNRFEQQNDDYGTGYYPPNTATSGYDSYQFADRVRERPDLWKSGPVDIRWDKYKQMFVASPEMFIGYALCDIPSSSGRWGPVLGGFEQDSDGNNILDASGNPILLPGYPTFTSGEIECGIGRYSDYNVPSGTADGGATSFSTHKLLIINRSITMDISSGALVIATRLNNGEYFPIFADCAADTM